MTAANTYNLTEGIDIFAQASDPGVASQNTGDLAAVEAEGAQPECSQQDDISPYRGRTVRILHRYRALSLEKGRMASSMSHLEYQASVSMYPTATFEDTVIFVFDVDLSLRELDQFSLELITRVVLQEYSPEATARSLQCSVKSVLRKVSEALDDLSKVFLRRGILGRSVACSTPRAKSCQEGKNGVFLVSDLEQSKYKVPKVVQNTPLTWYTRLRW